ncbi:MAG TPA: hypothetical protein VF315_08175, partial [Steroidobacteraceae bacterium]
MHRLCNTAPDRQSRAAHRLHRAAHLPSFTLRDRLDPGALEVDIHAALECIDIEIVFVSAVLSRAQTL